MVGVRKAFDSVFQSALKGYERLESDMFTTPEYDTLNKFWHQILSRKIDHQLYLIVRLPSSATVGSKDSLILC